MPVVTFAEDETQKRDGKTRNSWANTRRRRRRRDNERRGGETGFEKSRYSKINVSCVSNAKTCFRVKQRSFEIGFDGSNGAGRRYRFTILSPVRDVYAADSYENRFRSGSDYFSKRSRDRRQRFAFKFQTHRRVSFVLPFIRTENRPGCSERSGRNTRFARETCHARNDKSSRTRAILVENKKLFAFNSEN